MKKLALICALAFAATPQIVFAETPHHAAVAQTSQIHVGVNGMVCDFCAQALKKVFMKQPQVKDIDVSLEKKLVTIYLKPKMDMEDETIKTLIVDSGYAVSGIHHQLVK